MKKSKGLIAVLFLLAFCAGCGGGGKDAAQALPEPPGETAEQPEPEQAVPAPGKPVPGDGEPVPEPEPQEEPEPEPAGPLAGRVVCIDPGHCVTNEKQREQVSPKSSETKNVFGGGTAGSNQTEEQLNLRVGLQLKAELKEQGAEVRMTREVSEIAINNIERAEIGNQTDCCIRIHADGVDDSSVHGVSVLVPAGELLGWPEIVEPSRRLGELMLDRVVEQTGANDRGVVNRSDLVGFNWSKVPCVLIEMGFMTNPEEDRKLESEEYQQLIVAGMTESIIDWFAEQG